MVNFRFTLAACVMLAGCASTGVAPGAGGVGDLPALAVRTAAQLQQAATGDPARLEAVELELRRISDLLPSAGPVDMAPVAATPADVYAAPPQLAGARSLFAALSLGAYPSADTARAAWFGMNAAHGAVLSGLDARIETSRRGDGATAYVLKAGPLPGAAEADSLCARLREAGAVCAAGDFTGDDL